MVAFLAGGTITFLVAHVVGNALGAARLPPHWRFGIAGGALLLLAAVDLLARAARTYCPLGWRRQTPRALLRRHRLTIAASLWGLDTGLVVTTFRVAAVSWGALCLTTLGLAPRWTGATYAVGFLAPFMVLLFRPALRRASTARTMADPGLESMLRLRGSMQGVSAGLLSAAGAALLIQSVVYA